jgi:hypothetical protein
MIGSVMIFQLVMLCQEYLDSNFYRVVRVKSAHEKMIEEKQRIERETATKNEEEQRMIREMKKKHNEALQREVFEIKKQKIRVIKQRKLDKQKRMFQEPNSPFTHHRNTELEELDDDDDEEDISPSTSSPKKQPLTNQTPIKKKADSDFDFDNNVEIFFGSDNQDDDDDSVDWDESEEESEESESSEEEEDRTLSQSASSTQSGFGHIVFGESSDEEEFSSKSPPVRPGLIKRALAPQPQTTEQTQLVLVHFLRMFANQQQDPNAYGDLVEQMQNLGVLGRDKFVNDFSAYKSKFRNTFKDQMLNANTKGDVFTDFWLSHEKPTSPSPKHSTISYECDPSTKVQPTIESRYKTDFIEIEDLGVGGFGVVVKARNKIDQRYYAVKKIYFTHHDEKEEKNILREVNLLSRLHHANIVRYYNAWREENNETLDDIDARDDDYLDDDDEESRQVTMSNREKEPKYNRVLYIQMEYCQETLKDMIDGGKLIDSKDEAWRLLRQIVEALAYLHQHNVIHRDLKPS